MARLTGVLALVALGLLGGCVAPGGGIRQVALLDGAVTAAAPSGYCIAEGAGQRGADNAVVLMGRCSAGSGAEPAVITLSVGAAGSGGAMSDGGAALAAYFQSQDGLAALSRSGRAGDVRLLSAASSGGTFVLHVADREAGEYWRAIRPLRGRLATVSVSGAEGAPISAAEGRALLDAAVAALVAANREAGAPSI